MIIKFTVTLSDITVAAFAGEGATTGQAIKTALVEAIQTLLDEVNDNNPPEDDDEEDTEDGA